MINHTSLAPVLNLITLSGQSLFPTTKREIVSVAKTLDYPKLAIDEFSRYGSESISCRADFINRCERLGYIIEQRSARPLH